MAKSIVIIIAAALTLFSCNSDSGAIAKKQNIQEQLALDPFRSFFLDKYMQEDYIDCCMSKIEAKYEYDVINDIDLDDESSDIAVQIKEFETECWNYLLTKYRSELEKKGIEVHL
jgi:hypothetical protein